MQRSQIAIIGILILVFAGVLLWFRHVPSTKEGKVVVYVSQDQDYSEPILKDFEAQTSIIVKPIYDTETTKTTGLVNRLISEKDNPQADVFWNNEVSRSLILKRKGVLEPYFSPNAAGISDIYKDPQGYWTGFAARARVLLANTNLLTKQEMPTTLESLTRPRWKNKITLANPLFGTTASHTAALFVLWGNKKAQDYFKNLKANGVVIAESNGRTRDAVADSEVAIGFTDTDDANDAVVDKKPVKVIYPDQGEDEIGTLVIPNSVMLIKGAKNKNNAKKLIDYLLSAQVEEKLAFSKAAQMPLHQGVNRPKNVPDISQIKAMQVSWKQITDKLPASQQFLQELFLR